MEKLLDKRQIQRSVSKQRAREMRETKGKGKWGGNGEKKGGMNIGVND